MTDLEIAKSNLEGHTLALCRNGELLTSDLRGISPMLGYIDEGRKLCGYSAADRVVGRAAAMLFIKAGVAELYAEVLSDGARMLLEEHGVGVTYGESAQVIINRAGTGQCPMEEAVADITDIEIGITVLRERLARMRAGNEHGTKTH